MNNINFFSCKNDFFFFKKAAKINIFKKSVTLRRFYKKYTKFRRKGFNRLKHRTNWMIYSNVFKFWSHDFLKTRHYAKFHFLNGIFINNFFFYNFLYLKNKNLDALNNWNFLFYNFSKKSYRYIYRASQLNSNKNFSRSILPKISNSPITLGWLISTDFSINQSTNVTKILSCWENSYYLSLPDANTLVTENSLSTPFNLFFANINEFYKILILLQLFSLVSK